ncbi:MAG: hypothetical protein JWO13_1941 [Acidobacteriales bacterium]|nr:hypothetical protein [Terriglobales bacterium]
MAKREQEEFVVADRRKFTSEGELRPNAPPESAPPETAAPEAPAAQKEPSSPEQGARQEPEAPAREEMPAPPSQADQHAQNQEYQAAGRKIDSLLDEAGAQRPKDMEITFERLIVSLYMQAMAQLGMIREDENTPPRPDVISARQTIDTIALLGDKTKGNLTERESHMLQNVLFELRMAFLEITNMLTRPPAPGAPESGASTKK